MTTVLAAAAPDSAGDFAFILAALALICLAQFVNKRRRIRNDWERREQKIHRLRQESAAFAARWPGHRVAEAPYSDLAAEHARSNRLLALLGQHRTATNTADNRHLDGQIAAVQHWLATLPTRCLDPGPPPQQRLASLDPFTARPHSAVGSPLSPNGFPLGEPLLHLRGLPGVDDIVCSVQSVSYRQVAVIKPRGAAPWAWRDPTRDVHFEVLRADGAPLLYLTRFGGTSQRLEIYDHAGYAVAQLQQSGSLWQVARSQRVAFDMVFQGQRLGTSQVRRRSISPDGEDAVSDATGQTIALVEPVRRNPGAPRTSFDFILHCIEPQPFPVPHLLLAVGFSHYLYSRSWR